LEHDRQATESAVTVAQAKNTFPRVYVTYIIYSNINNIKNTKEDIKIMVNCRK